MAIESLRNDDTKVGRGRTRYWAAAVSGDQVITKARRIVVNVIPTGGALVVAEKQRDGTVANFTYSALDIVMRGGTLEGEFYTLIASGSTCTDIVVEW